MAESLTVELTGEALALLQDLAERSGNELQVELKNAVVDRHYFIGLRGGDIALQGGEESSPGWLKMVL